MLGTDFPIFGVVLLALAFGIFWLFFAAGESLTPKKSLLSGKERSQEEISRKGFWKGLVLFFIAILVFNLLTGFLNN
jgi:type II secretory pathway component PulL